MFLLYFYYTDKSYDSDDDIPISQLVLKRKAKAYEEEESMDNEQEEDEESNLKTNEAIGTIASFVLRLDSSSSSCSL